MLSVRTLERIFYLPKRQSLGDVVVPSPTLSYVQAVELEIYLYGAVTSPCLVQEALCAIQGRQNDNPIVEEGCLLIGSDGTYSSPWRYETLRRHFGGLEAVEAHSVEMVKGVVEGVFRRSGHRRLVDYWRTLVALKPLTPYAYFRFDLEGLSARRLRRIMRLFDEDDMDRRLAVLDRTHNASVPLLEGPPGLVIAGSLPAVQRYVQESRSEAENVFPASYIFAVCLLRGAPLNLDRSFSEPAGIAPSLLRIQIAQTLYNSINKRTPRELLVRLLAMYGVRCPALANDEVDAYAPYQIPLRYSKSKALHLLKKCRLHKTPEGKAAIKQLRL